ncbi:MAG TPA: beta-propeller fold lactonase family protein [Candidatus Dormibacteraeota bacterium]|nr:beta-propeller fold lactonase family protein [Candidatus Dormibacteraeota bacterium]
MKSPFRLLVVLAAMAATAVAAAAPVQASDSGGGAVFVQTNDPTGNSIDAFHRNGDGTLTFAASYPTGGLGGRELGAGSDPIATQGSLRLDEGQLLAVNAGSNTVSAFAVNGDQLALTQVVGSGGPFPASIATHGDLVYVVDAGGAGFVSGFRLAGGKLHPIEGSTRSLGLANGNPPFFLASPAQVGFTPDGEHLVVTTKTNNTVEVFSVNPDGRLSAAPFENAAAPVPFAWVFDPAGRIVLNFAGTSSLQTFTVNEDNTITPVSAPVSDTRAALCWITPAGGYLYTSNTGSGDVSQFRVLADGTVVLVNPVAAPGIPGATDSAAGGQTLYVQSGSTSTVHVFTIGAGGALTPIQVAAVPDGGSQEGIVVT